MLSKYNFPIQSLKHNSFVAVAVNIQRLIFNRNPYQIPRTNNKEVCKLMILGNKERGEIEDVIIDDY